MRSWWNKRRAGTTPGRRLIALRPVVSGVALALVLVGCASAPRTAPDGATAGDPRLESVVALMADERYVEAESALQALAGPLGEDPAYLFNLGIVYAQTERLEQAEQALAAAQSRAPKAALIANELGIVRRKRGDFAGAAEAYRQAIAADAGFANAHYNLGVLLDLYLAQPIDALGHYETYLALKPDGDKTVDRWVKDLRRRTKTAPASAGVQQRTTR